MSENSFHLLGYASGIAGSDIRSGDGPLIIQKSPFLSELKEKGISLQWDEIISPPQKPSNFLEVSVANICDHLAKKVSTLVRQNKFFSVIGGDHTAAVGTFSGVYDAMHTKGELGLIWLDAHMDSHIPETTETGRIHGMPLASLLGYGYPNLASISQPGPKVLSENICLIGVRSFEKGEAELLRRLKVRIYFIEEVEKRGFINVFREALDIVKLNTVCYGISLDMDCIDPEEAPGVDVSAPGGLHANDIRDALSLVASDPKLITTEIVEFNPARDIDHKTEKLVVSFLDTLVEGKKQMLNSR